MNEIEIPPKINYKNKQIQIGKLKLNYWEEGDGTDTLFLIHGHTGNVEEWYFQVFYFEKDYKVIAIDLRGHGKSQIDEKEMNFNDLAEDLNIFLEKKGISKIILIGHSMGGMIAQLFTLNYPEKVKKLVLISTTPGSPPRKIPESYLEYMRATEVPKLIEMTSKLASIPIDKISPERRDFYKKLQQWSLIRRAKAISNDTYIKYLLASSNFDVRSLLNKITVPTLIISGDKDKLVQIKNSKLLNEKIPNSKLVTLTECGHAPQREYFKKFNEILSKFLKGEIKVSNNPKKKENENIISLRGTVKHLPFEGGFFGIVGEDGNKYKPKKLESEFQKNGLKVLFKAKKIPMASIHMWGTTIKILEIKKI